MQQRRRGAPARLGAFPTAKPAGEIMNETCRWMGQGCKIDLARRLAIRFATRARRLVGEALFEGLNLGYSACSIAAGIFATDISDRATWLSN